MKLTKSEEELMNILWKHKKAFMKDLLDAYPEPKPATTTVATLLKGAGYATGAFGKWGLGSPGSEGDPTQQGFDRFYGYNCQRNAHTFYPTWLFDDKKKIELDGKTYSHDLIVEEALEFIRTNKDRPLFCYMPVTIPHAAMHVPEEYVKPFRKPFEKYENVIGRYRPPLVKNPVAAFAGMMTKLDEDVGKVLDLLKALEIDEKTLVIFTSDNGPHKEGGHRPEVFDSNGPLRGLKRSVTEGGIRVPMLAWWPGTVEAGAQSDHISAFWDVLPTFCDMAGIKTPEDLDGISYLPALTGKGEQKKHDYLYWAFYEQGGKRAIRMGPWKMVQLHLKKKPNSPMELYNLDEDIGEEKNVAEAHPEILKRMKEIIAEAESPSSIPAWQFSKN
ncbi:MAG: sulfatase-like hydrolase/transferase [Verrucomicrobiota bacterium]